LDVNLTGHLWGMPVNLMGQITQGNISSNLGVQTTYPWTPVFAGLIGAIIGAILSFYLNYAKTKAMMKWETKYNAYNAILEFDKGRPINSAERKQEIRFAMRLKSLSENEEIKAIAHKMIIGEFNDLADKQQFIDEQFIPAIEKDLKDTMNFIRWISWK